MPFHASVLGLSAKKRKTDISGTRELTGEESLSEIISSLSPEMQEQISGRISGLIGGAGGEISTGDKAIVEAARREGQQEIGRSETLLATAGGSRLSSFVQGATAEAQAGLATSIGQLTGELSARGEERRIAETSALLDVLKGATTERVGERKRKEREATTSAERSSELGFDLSLGF